MSESCPQFECNDYDDGPHTPCQCPKCKGWLKWVEVDGEQQPICNKCKTPLIAIYDAPEDEWEAKSMKEDHWSRGKICIRKPLPELEIKNTKEEKSNE